MYLDSYNNRTRGRGVVSVYAPPGRNHKTRIFTKFSKSIFKIYVYWIFYNNLWFSKEDIKIEKVREDGEEWGRSEEGGGRRGQRARPAFFLPRKEDICHEDCPHDILHF